jgi:hypothetical protein
MSMDSAIDFNNVDYSQFDTTYSIADIVQQQSISNITNTNGTTATVNRNELMAAQAAEKSTRHLMAMILPKKTAAYVCLPNLCTLLLH